MPMATRPKAAAAISLFQPIILAPAVKVAGALAVETVVPLADGLTDALASVVA